jgi:hypothetical protein
MSENNDIGRPTTYSQAFVDKFCDAVSTTSKSIEDICTELRKEDPNFPCPSTIYLWLAKHEEFSEQYARAKIAQVTVLINEILKIADDASRDFTLNEDGKWVIDGEHVQRSRLKIDTRKWLAGKLVPKVYGDRIIADINDISKKPINEMSKDELMREYQASKKALEELDA